MLQSLNIRLISQSLPLHFYVFACIYHFFNCTIYLHLNINMLNKPKCLYIYIKIATPKWLTTSSSSYYKRCNFTIYILNMPLLGSLASPQVWDEEMVLIIYIINILPRTFLGSHSRMGKTCWCILIGGPHTRPTCASIMNARKTTRFGHASKSWTCKLEHNLITSILVTSLPQYCFVDRTINFSD